MRNAASTPLTPTLSPHLFVLTPSPRRWVERGNVFGAASFLPLAPNYWGRGMRRVGEATAEPYPKLGEGDSNA